MTKVKKPYPIGKRINVGILTLCLLWMFIAQDKANGQTQTQNYSTVKNTAIGGSGVMIGLGAAACTAMSAGSCGAIIASGVMLGALGGTLSAMGDPGQGRDCVDPMHCGDTMDMPDNDYDSCGIECQADMGPGAGGSPEYNDNAWYQLPW